jgi:hypothetical protein
LFFELAKEFTSNEKGQLVFKAVYFGVGYSRLNCPLGLGTTSSLQEKNPKARIRIK